MTSNGSPYSLYEQLVPIATRTVPLLQLSDAAWWTPRLWESSCASVRSTNDPLIQTCDPGISARPAQPQSITYGKAYTTCWYEERFTPAAAAIWFAVAAQVSMAQPELACGSWYQPKTSPLIVVEPNDSSWK